MAARYFQPSRPGGPATDSVGRKHGLCVRCNMTTPDFRRVFDDYVPLCGQCRRRLPDMERVLRKALADE